MKFRIISVFLASALLFMSACSGNTSSSSETYSQIEVSSTVSSEDSSQESPSSNEVSSDVSSLEPSSSEDTSDPEPSSEPEPSSDPESSEPESSDPVISVADGNVPYALPEGSRVSDSYFDDAVFIGDSVSLKLDRYTMQQRNSNPNFFGKAQFLTAGSMGSGNALAAPSDDSIHPLFNGQKMSLADSVQASGAKKVYIMLGMNDMAIYGVDGAVDNMETLIGTILAKTPDATIYVESATPLVASQNFSEHKLNNTNLDAYNKKLSALCQSKGWYFVNVWSVVNDGNGNLKDAYCSDPDSMGIHFTDAGCGAWIDYLYTHTA